MNVFDPLYESKDKVRVYSADMALLDALARACEVLHCDKPTQILVSSMTSRGGRALLQIDLLELASYPWPTWRSYAERQECIVSALQNLALYGCRGNELAFGCRSGDDLRYRHWVLVDPVAMQPRLVNGEQVRSDDYRFVALR